MEILVLMFLLAFTPAGDLVAGPDDYGNVILWSAKSGDQVQMLKANSEQVTSIAIRDDGKFMVTGGKDGSVALWDMKTRSIIKTEAAHTDWVMATQFSSDGDTLMTAGKDGTICFWTLPEFIRYDAVMTESGHLFTASLSSNGQWAAATDGQGYLYVWQSGKKWKLSKKFKDAQALSVAFNPSGDLLVAGGEGGEIKAFRAKNNAWEQVRTWNTSLDYVTSLDFCTDSSCILLVSGYEAAYAMPVRENAVPVMIYDASGEDEMGVWDIALSAQGASMATIDAAGRVDVTRPQN